MGIKPGVKEGRTPSAAETERLTTEEGESIHGRNRWLDCVLKALTPHDSRRHVLKLQKSEKAEKKKKQRWGIDEEED
jgi:hypothetical protein